MVSEAPFVPLLGKELRDVLSSRAFWVMLLLFAPLVGYSFIQAVALYAEASRSAAQFPELARGLSPFDGIVVPTLGALYLATTLLFPFVAIHAIGAEKQNGGQKLLLQLPYRLPALILAKLSALFAAWLAMLAACLSALVIWQMLGGHLSTGETLNLILGHLLYAMVIAGIGLFAASVADGSATAAIVTLAFTIGFWVLDFAAAGQSGLIRKVAAVSLTAVLRTFERGILSGSTLVGGAMAAASLIALAALWLHPGARFDRRLLLSGAVVLATGVAMAGAARLHLYADMTENRRNSFPAADAAALAAVRDRLTIIVHLSPEDPRFIDFERGVLGKLRRTVPDSEVIIAAQGRSALFSTGDDTYGQVIYRYHVQEETSRSTGVGEVLPLIYRLAGVERPAARPGTDYTGYPLVADARLAGLWFYGGLPLLLLAAWAMLSGLPHRVRDAWSRA